MFVAISDTHVPDAEPDVNSCLNIAPPMSWTSGLRRVTTVWVVATVLTTSATQVAAAGNTSWQWQNPQPQGNTVTAAACPSPTICIANATREVLRTTDSGAHWTAVSFALQGGATAFSCPSQTVC